MTTRAGFQVHTHLRVLEFKKEVPVRYEPTRKEIWGLIACCAFALYFMAACGWLGWEIVLFIKAWWGSL